MILKFFIYNLIFGSVLADNDIYIDNYGVYIQSDESVSVFIIDTNEVEIHLGIRIPIINNENLGSNSCQFNTSEVDFPNANQIIKKLIQKNLGIYNENSKILESDLFIHTTDNGNKNQTFKSIEKNYFEIKPVHQIIKKDSLFKIIAYNGYRAIETDEILLKTIEPLFDGKVDDDNNIFVFDCKRAVKTKQLIIGSRRPIFKIIMIMMGPIKNFDLAYIQKNFNVKYNIFNSEHNAQTFAVDCSYEVVATDSRWPSIITDCEINRDLLNSKAKFLITLTFSFESIAHCKSTRIREMKLFTERKTRIRRQFGEVALGATVGLLGKEIFTYFSKKNIGTEVQELKK